MIRLQEGHSMTRHETETSPKELSPAQIKEHLRQSMESVRLFNGSPVFVGQRITDGKPFSNDPIHPTGDPDQPFVPAIFAPKRTLELLDTTLSEKGAFTDVVCASVGQFLDLTRRIANPDLKKSSEIREQRNAVVLMAVQMRRDELLTDPDDQDAIDSAHLQVDQLARLTAQFLQIDSVTDGAEFQRITEIAADTTMAVLELAGNLLSDSSASPDAVEA